MIMYDPYVIIYGPYMIIYGPYETSYGLMLDAMQGGVPRRAKPTL